MPLKSGFENNGWNVDLLAVEVGARGYCSRLILKCSMECSFCIYLARKNKAWSFKDTGLSLKAPEDLLVHQNPHSSTSKTNSLQPHPPLPVDFINKGNTCYANAILQVMSVLHFSPIINSSLSKFLKREILEAEKKSFCPSCNCLTESTRETSIIDPTSSIFHFTFKANKRPASI